MNRCGLIWTAVVLVAVAAGLFFLLRGTESGGSVVDDGLPSRAEVPGQNLPKKRLSEARVKGGVRPNAVRPSVKRRAEEADEDSSRTPEEKKLAADIEKALEEEDFVLAKKCASLALVCKDTEIRQSMVDALGWFGKDALPELTSFLADADEDVRGSACCEWSSAVSDIEDEREKVSVVEMAMGVISDEDFLEGISSEYIGVDEKIAVESLMRIVADGKSEQGVVKAKETYEFVTGDEWQGADEARRWLAEEYTPPED